MVGWPSTQRESAWSSGGEHVALGQKNIDQRMALIAKLEIDGHDTTLVMLLAHFLELQVACEENRQRLLQQLTAKDESHETWGFCFDRRRIKIERLGANPSHQLSA